jgi:hypothetical protein
MSNNNSNNGKGPKNFTTTPPPGAVSPVGLRFSSNSNYENLSTVRGNGSNNGLSQLSEFNREEEFELPETEVPPRTPNGVLNNLSVWSNNGTATTLRMNNTTKNNGNSLPAYLTQNRTSNNNQFPRITAKNMKEYPTLGGNIFSNNKTPKKPGKSRKNRKNRKNRSTRKNRK